MDRQRMERCLEVVAAYRASGLKSKDLGPQYTEHKCRRYMEVPDHADGDS